MARRLVVKITCGPEALERLNQGLTVASTALASGVDVSVWLTGEAVWVAVPGRAEEWDLPHAADLAELHHVLVDGARVTVCGQCAARRELTTDDLVPGVRIAGAASFVEEIMAEGAQAIVY